MCGERTLPCRRCYNSGNHQTVASYDEFLQKKAVISFVVKRFIAVGLDKLARDKSLDYDRGRTPILVV
jgi:hypothetical protein